MAALLAISASHYTKVKHISLSRRKNKCSTVYINFQTSCRGEPLLFYSVLLCWLRASSMRVLKCAQNEQAGEQNAFKKISATFYQAYFSSFVRRGCWRVPGKGVVVFDLCLSFAPKPTPESHEQLVLGP